MGLCTASCGGSEGTCIRSSVSSGRVLSLVSTTITVVQVLPLGNPPQGPFRYTGWEEGDEVLDESQSGRNGRESLMKGRH